MTHDEYQTYVSARSDMELRLIAFLACYARVLTTEKLILGSWITAGGADRDALLARFEVLNCFTADIIANAEEVQEQMFEDAFGPGPDEGALHVMLSKLALNGHI